MSFRKYVCAAALMMAALGGASTSSFAMGGASVGVKTVGPVGDENSACNASEYEVSQGYGHYCCHDSIYASSGRICRTYPGEGYNTTCNKPKYTRYIGSAAYCCSTNSSGSEECNKLW